MPLINAAEAYATKWEVIVYGQPGVGKTTLFAEAPNSLYIEVDDNGHTVLQGNSKATIFYTRVWSELVRFVKALPTSSLIKEIDTIVVDTISECQVLERLNQVGAEMDEALKFNQNVFTINNFRIMAMVRLLKRTGKNIAWLCHETTELTEKQEKLIRPALSATLLSTVCAGVDGQFYYRRQGANRVLETDGMGQVQTKSRFTKSRPLVNPTWADLSKLLTSNMKADN